MTLIQVLIVLAVVAAVAAVAAGVVRGGLDEPASSLPSTGLDDGLPRVGRLDDGRLDDGRLDDGRLDDGLSSIDLAQVRFSLGLRGYRMDEVDEVLDRAGVELDARDAQIRDLRDRLALLEHELDQRAEQPAQQRAEQRVQQHADAEER